MKCSMLASKQMKVNSQELGIERAFFFFIIFFNI